MRIVLLNQPFYPDVVSTAQMSKDLADHLAAAGHEVHAVASRSIYGKAGATLPRRETIGTIRVHRVGFSLFGKRGLLARAFDFAFFYVLATIRVLTLPRPDVVVGFTTPPMIALVGLICRMLRGSRSVYWVMDLYPDIAVASGAFGPRSFITRVFDFLGRHLLKRCDATVVLGRCMRDRVLAKGAPAERVHLIPVWPIDADIRPVTREENKLRREWGIPETDCVVMYSGNFGIAHEARTVCNAILALRDHRGIRFEFIGSGTRRKEVEAFLAEHGLSNARYRDYTPRQRLAESLSAGDIHLISVRDGFEGLIVPSKLYGIMAAARPAIFVGSVKSEVAMMTEESGCGVNIAEGDADGLVRAIVEMAADPARRARLGEAGRKALTGKYDKRAACGAWMALLEQLTGKPEPAKDAA